MLLVSLLDDEPTGEIASTEAAKEKRLKEGLELAASTANSLAQQVASSIQLKFFGRGLCGCYVRSRSVDTTMM